MVLNRFLLRTPSSRAHSSDARDRCRAESARARSRARNAKVRGLDRVFGVPISL